MKEGKVTRRERNEERRKERRWNHGGQLCRQLSPFTSHYITIFSYSCLNQEFIFIPETTYTAAFFFRAAISPALNILHWTSPSAYSARALASLFERELHLGRHERKIRKLSFLPFIRQNWRKSGASRRLHNRWPASANTGSIIRSDKWNRLRRKTWDCRRVYFRSAACLTCVFTFLTISPMTSAKLPTCVDRAVQLFANVVAVHLSHLLVRVVKETLNGECRLRKERHSLKLVRRKKTIQQKKKWI